MGGSTIPSDELNEMLALVTEFDMAAMATGMNELFYIREDCEKARFQLERHKDVSSGLTVLNGLKISFIGGLRKFKFLTVGQEDSGYLDQRHLFGEEVARAFPSSERDIREGGNCLACGCSTASVFHLMRAAEFALRALARDRDVHFKDKPLEDKEWGTILGALEGKLTTLRAANRNNWLRSEARDAQIVFYNEVVQELRGFNDAWRRQVSHADTLAFYEPDTARGIFKHVRTFMQKLALKISEGFGTPEYWAGV